MTHEDLEKSSLKFKTRILEPSQPKNLQVTNKRKVQAMLQCKYKAKIVDLFDFSSVDNSSILCLIEGC